MTKNEKMNEARNVYLSCGLCPMCAEHRDLAIINGKEATRCRPCLDKVSWPLVPRKARKP